MTDPFELIEETQIGHIALADLADLIVILPASANIIGEIANGIADDFLSTMVMAAKAPVLFAPSMNVNMWENKALQKNIKTLGDRDYHFMEPGEGVLACHWYGKGRLAELGPDYPLCVECKLKENTCMFTKGSVCLGPVTRAGCGAICPTYGDSCEACRGFISNPNDTSMLDLLAKHGLTVEDITTRYTMFTTYQVREQLMKKEAQRCVNESMFIT